jgi:hypothetical protein
MNAEDEVRMLLHDHGAVLVRRRTHRVYRFPDGRSFTLPRSPSDHRWSQNALQDLRRLLGVERALHKNANRKRKPGMGPSTKNGYRADRVQTALESAIGPGDVLAGASTGDRRVARK